VWFALLRDYSRLSFRRFDAFARRLGAISQAVTNKNSTFSLGGMIMNGSAKQMLAYSLTLMLLSPASPAFAQTSATASGDDAIYCRAPEQRTDSRMMGPKVCMPLGKWKELRAKGLDVSADGQSYQQIQNGAGAGSMGTSYGLSPQQ
jgi:hypothetical protein